MDEDIDEMIAALPEESNDLREILKALLKRITGFLERLDALEDRLKTPIKQGGKK